jgi:hypothetical protein
MKLSHIVVVSFLKINSFSPDVLGHFLKNGFKCCATSLWKPQLVTFSAYAIKLLCLQVQTINNHKSISCFQAHLSNYPIFIDLRWFLRFVYFLVGWHAGAVSLAPYPLDGVIFTQLACTLNGIIFCLYWEKLTYLSINIVIILLWVTWLGFSLIRKN